MYDGILRVTLDIDGQVEESFKSFTEKEVETGAPINMMNRTGFGKKTKRYGFMLEYVIPKTGSRDWSTLVDNDAVVSAYLDGGSKITFRGVRLLKRGEEKIDGDNELVCELDFMAAERDPAL